MFPALCTTDTASTISCLKKRLLYHLPQPCFLFQLNASLALSFPWWTQVADPHPKIIALTMNASHCVLKTLPVPPHVSMKRFQYQLPCFTQPSVECKSNAQCPLWPQLCLIELIPYWNNACDLNWAGNTCTSRATLMSIVKHAARQICSENKHSPTFSWKFCEKPAAWKSVFVWSDQTVGLEILCATHDSAPAQNGECGCVRILPISKMPKKKAKTPNFLDD